MSARSPAPAAAIPFQPAHRAGSDAPFLIGMWGVGGSYVC